MSSESDPLIEPIEVHDDSKVSWTASLFNLTNTSIGAGTLALPYVMHQCGLLLGVVSVAIVGTLSWFGLYFLTQCKVLTRRRTFIEIAHAAYGSQGERFASGALFLMLFGPLSAYFSIVGSYLRTTVEEILHSDHHNEWYTQKIFIMALVGVTVMLPLSFKSMKFISYIAIVALFAMLFAIVLIPITYFMDLAKPDWQAPPVRWILNTEDSWTLLAAFSTIGMAFVNHSIVVECTTDLANPTHLRQHTLTASSSVLITILYMLTSVTGYLHFGYGVKGNILESYPEGQAYEITVARVLVAVCIALTYPAFVNPARSCLSGLIRRSKPRMRSSDDSLNLLDQELSEQSRFKFLDNPKFTMAWQTVLIFLLSFAIAVLVPTLDKIFAFFGSLTGSLVVYILPVVFFVKIASQFSLVYVEWSTGFLKYPRVYVLGCLHYEEATSPIEQQDFRLSRPVPENQRWDLHPRIVQTALYLNVFVGLFLFVFGTAYNSFDLVKSLM